MKYFVYSLSKPSSTSPFYIGFSQNPKRPYGHIAEAKRFINGEKINNPNHIKLGILKEIILSNNEPIITILFETEDRLLALNEEIRLIAFYGRRHNNSGWLSNMTAGGEGMRDNQKHWSRGFTKETHDSLAKMSVTRSGQTAWNKGMKGYGAGKKNNFYGKIHSDLVKENNSRYAKEHFVGAGNPNSKTFKFTSPQGLEYFTTGDFGKICKEFDLPLSSMRKLLKTQKQLASGKTAGWQVIEV